MKSARKEHSGARVSGPLKGAERNLALGFLRDEGYKEAIQSDDEVYAAWIQTEVVGVVRLALEHGVIVLRGMRVKHDLRSQGIGTLLLHKLAATLGSQTCYCIPYAWLLEFYGRIGFEKIPVDCAPRFLAQRIADYDKRGLNVELMIRHPNR